MFNKFSQFYSWWQIADIHISLENRILIIQFIIQYSLNDLYLKLYWLIDDLIHSPIYCSGTKFTGLTNFIQPNVKIPPSYPVD